MNNFPKIYKTNHCPPLFLALFLVTTITVLFLAQFDYASADNIQGGIKLFQTSNVVVTFLSSEAAENNIFGISKPISRALGTGHGTAPGTNFDLGTINSGEELVFYITNGANYTFYSTSASTNPDGISHAVITSLGSNKWQIGFEDQYGGGDRDYNDIVIKVTATPICITHFSKKCVDNDIYWFNSCNNKEDLFQACGLNQVCQNAECINITCATNSDCGTNGYVGDPFCQGNGVYRNYRTFTCNNPGTANSYCSTNTTAQLQTTCTSNQTCSNGACININSCISHSYQRCIGDYLYWYDSCGNIQEGQLCPAGCYNNSCQNYTTSTLTVTKTVKNLTSNSGFLTSISANPQDVLMFMITLQVSGNQDIQNVVVKDILPATLIYNNQLVVSRSGGAYSNYSGDIVSGLNLNTIPAGQTVTITYQAQVAGPSSFSYGTTTINNNSYITSSASGYNTATASVIVTKAGVLGASTISTGLTNNFWLDLFILPLLITLILIWGWKLGLFLWLEKWIDEKKKNHHIYKTEKEFASRIAKIQKIGDR